MERGCIEVDKADNEYSEGTHTKLPSYGPVRSLVDKSFGDLNIGDVTFDGKVKYSKKSTVHGNVLL